MNKKSTLALGLFILLLIAVVTATNTLRVNAQALPVHNLNTGANYATIQEAINDPFTGSGNTILVDAGTYSEQVVVNKTLKLVGANSEATIIDGQGTATYLFHVIANSVVIANFTLRNTNPDPNLRSPAVRVYNVTNVMINNLIITEAIYGVEIRNSSFTTITSCKIYKSQTYGIDIHDTSRNNTIVANTLETDSAGTALSFEDSGSMFSRVYHNNFVNNTHDVYLVAINYFDDGYPSGGNYWSKYTGVDLDDDGIGDTPHTVFGVVNDNYPLVGNFSAFPLSPGVKAYEVDLTSNSTVSAFQFFTATRTVQFSVSSAATGTSFCRISIPYGLVYPPYNVTIDGQTKPFDNLFDNGTFRWIYFTYNGTASTVTIQSAASIHLQSPTELAPAYMYPGMTLTISVVYTENSALNLTIEVFNATTIIGNLTINASGLQNGTDILLSANVSLADSAAEGFYDANVTLFNAADMSREATEANSVIVDVTPPTIGTVSQNPSPSGVHVGDTVTVNVEVSDFLSGLKQATLSYITDEGLWTDVAMTNLLGDIYNATIQSFAYNTNVSYVITAEDNANNTVTTQDLGYMFQYRVIPEFPTPPILLLLIAATLLTVATYRKMRFRRKLTLA